MIKSNSEVTKLTNALAKLQVEILEHEQTKQQLVQKTSELSAILQLIPDAYLLLDANGTVLKYQPGKTQNPSSLPEMIPGRQILEYLPEQARDEFQQAIAQALQTQSPISFTYTATSTFVVRLLSLSPQQVIVLIRESYQPLETEFSHSHIKFQDIVENAKNIIFTLTTEGILSYVSPNWKDILGHELADVIGQSFVPFVHPDDVPLCLDYLSKIIHTGQNQEAIEYRVKHKNGSWRWHTSNASTIKDANDNILYCLGISHDITARKLAEKALAEKVKLANFRAEVDALLAHSSSLQEIMHGCTEAIVKHLEAAFARIWILNKQENILELQVSSGMYTHVDGPHRRVPVGQFKIGLIAEEGKPHLTNSVQTDPRVGNKEWAKNEGMVAFAGYPLIIDGETLGVIAMFSRHILSESTFEALRITAHEIAIGIKRKQTEAALRESEAKFREIAQKEALLNRLASQIHASLELNAIVETAVKEICQLLQIDRCAFWWYRQNIDVPYWEIVYEVQTCPDKCLLPTQINDVEAKLIAANTLNKQMIRINNLETVTDATAQKFLRDFGLTAFMSLPVHTQSGEIGAFSCGSCSGFRLWLDNEVELLQAVTNQLAIAIDQAKLYSQSRIAAQAAEEKAQQLEAALLELQQAQVQLIHSEKMSSLGQLVAGIAHEINNPVNFIYGNINHAREYVRDLLHLVELYQQHYCPPLPEIHEQIYAMDLDFLSQDLLKVLDSMNVGAERIRQIVLSLRNFSRLDEDGMKPVDIHEGIDSTLLLLQNRLKAKAEYSEIHIIKEYGNLPKVFCHGGQMNQVFMNLLTNAIDALEAGIGNGEWGVGEKSHPIPHILPPTPQILIRTELTADQQVLIRIADNGPGMTEEVRDRLFDPFFTTKPVGKGTGMGLSISYQIIVNKHQGKLQCISAPGEGAEFIITIPLSELGS
ncbi:PAS domain S-box [Nostoc sp. PCC 7524]|uniref:GAF domain-containing protein n=1 Tax=Nostoc sp. (strain ATCC 29411 / PCC 7524) TaxID=28072 RepID=UPI00029EC38F|nr:GAF domain-containing protein [Nostoc sp. PCC 7524]AFY48928.1 PAS domain S-box [Nostoc sp. PCC 7524]